MHSKELYTWLYWGGHEFPGTWSAFFALLYFSPVINSLTEIYNCKSCVVVECMQLPPGSAEKFGLSLWYSPVAKAILRWYFNSSSVPGRTWTYLNNLVYGLPRLFNHSQCCKIWEKIQIAVAMPFVAVRNTFSFPRSSTSSLRCVFSSNDNQIYRLKLSCWSSIEMHVIIVKSLKSTGADSSTCHWQWHLFCVHRVHAMVSTDPLCILNKTQKCNLVLKILNDLELILFVYCFSFWFPP